MQEKFNTKFLVNKKPVELNPFVNDFLAQVTVGAVKSLKGVDYIKSIEVTREHGDLTVNVNGEEITITPFPNEIISNTVIGLSSTLKGVSDIESFNIKVTAV